MIRILKKSMKKAKYVIRFNNKSVFYSGHRETFNMLEGKVCVGGKAENKETAEVGSRL